MFCLQTGGLISTNPRARFSKQADGPHLQAKCCQPGFTLLHRTTLAGHEHAVDNNFIAKSHLHLEYVVYQFH